MSSSGLPDPQRWAVLCSQGLGAQPESVPRTCHSRDSNLVFFSVIILPLRETSVGHNF